MPLYIVRWPNLSAALVRASSEYELIDILDEIANPDSCTWSVYRGPVFLDIELGARIEIEDDGREVGLHEPSRPLDPARMRIVGARDMASREAPAMTIRCVGETGEEMERTIAEFAFPATAAVYWGEEYDIDPGALEKALEEDAMRLVEYSWRHSQLYRSTDPDAKLALMMDASLRWVKQTGRGGAAGEGGLGSSVQGALEDDELDAELEDEELDEKLEDEELEDEELEDEELELAGDPIEDIAALLDMARAEWLETGDADALRDAMVDILEVLDHDDF